MKLRDEPEDREDFEDLLDYVEHEGVFKGFMIAVGIEAVAAVVVVIGYLVLT